MNRKSLLIGALVALPLLVGGGALAFAASGSQGQSPAQVFLADVASHLGISTQKLQSALQQARLDQVQSLLSQGKITQAQAQQMEANIKSGKAGAGFGMKHAGRHFRGAMDGRAAMQAAATYLGLTPQQLFAELGQGKSLSDIATATSGKSVAGLESAITSAITQDLQQAVSSGRMTQQQMQQAQSKLQSFVQQFVTRKGAKGPRGGMGGGGWGFGSPGLGSQQGTPPATN